MSKKKQPAAPPPQPQRKVFTLKLTKLELTHVRDLFSVVLPTEMKETVSQRLATLQERSLVEAKLWQKVATACKDAELPTDDDAPDFVVAATTTPPIGVFTLASDSNQQESSEENLFAEKEDEE